MWWRRVAHIFKAVFAELYHQMKEDEHGEPQTPQHHLLHPLHVQHAKDEDELVEDEVPELIFQMLWDGERTRAAWHQDKFSARYPLHAELFKSTGTHVHSESPLLTMA